MPRTPKKLHYIYKTTRKITGKFYVGMHSTDNLEDGYLGSGKILGYSRNKYGDENHVKEILEYCSSRDELKKREKEIVNKELLADPLNINLKYGGEGGGGFWSEQHKQKFMLAAKISSAIGRANMSKEDLHAASIKRETTKKVRNSYGRHGWKLSDVQITNRSKTLRELNHQQGNKNSQFGVKRIGISKSGVKKKVLLEELQHYLDAGWTKGYKNL